MSMRLQDMITAIVPHGVLTPNVEAFINTYALPVAIAIPMAVLLYFFGTRKGSGDKESRFGPGAEPPTLRDRVEPPNPATRPAVPAGTGTVPAGVATRPGPAGAAPAGPTAVATAPVAIGAGAPPPQAPASTAPSVPVPMILVVEDSAVSRTKLAKLFASAGYRVETAVDGVDALEKLAVHHVNVLVTDLEMPNMDGLQLISAVLGSMETDDIPIVAVTGHDELQAHVRDIQGLYGLFRKPWNDRELLKRVETLSVLRKPRGERVAS